MAAAVQEELDFMRQLKVYLEVPADFAAQNCLRPIGTRWIYTNMADAKNPQIRARLVAQETKRNSDLTADDASSTFAATPPLEGLRFMLSKCMTGPRAKVSETAVLGFYDISRAHFHSAARRKTVIRTPLEDTGYPSGFALLDESMYGTKDAAQCFDVACENAIAQMGYTIGLFSPCLYLHKTKNVAVFRHGDDFVVCGTRIQQAEFKSEQGQYFIVKQLAILGPSLALGDVPELRILNRLVRWVKPPYGSGAERLEYEADPRHAELLVHQLGLSRSSKGVSTPGERNKPSVDCGTPLGRDEHFLYRSATMRLCYLALDRPDLQFPSKELARWMQKPEVGDLEGLKRAARYLLRHGRLVQEFVRQFEEPQHLVVFTDSDHAGCLRTRKSTSSFKIMYGQHLLRSASSTQAVISLSSGDSEFYSLVKGVAAGLGAVAMLRDLGVELTGDATVEVKVDATAGKGVAMRRGAGRIRHIATPTSWVQKLVQDGKVKVSNILGNANPADLGSKRLDAASILKHRTHCKFTFQNLTKLYGPRSKMTSYRQKTRTRELYDRVLSDDGDYISGGGPDGRRTWLKFIAWDDLEYFSARAFVDPRPSEALWVQEGLINNHLFSTVF